MPSAFTLEMSKLLLEPSMKTTLAPSDDQLVSKLVPGNSHQTRGPRAVRVHRVGRGEACARRLSNTIFVPSADTAGSLSGTALLVSSLTSLPSGFIE